MKANVIRSKLAKYLHKGSDTILLEVLEGVPRSLTGGLWIETPVSDLENLTESADFNLEASGYRKYLDKWFKEGLISAGERDTGKLE